MESSGAPLTEEKTKQAVDNALAEVHLRMVVKEAELLREQCQAALDAYHTLRDVCRWSMQYEGKTAQEWQSVAASYQKTLQETTATMNRYHADWQNAVGQVQDLQAQQAQWQMHHGELTTALRDVSDELAATRKQIGRAEEKENAAPVPAPGQAGSLSHPGEPAAHVGVVKERRIVLKLMADVETCFLLHSDGGFSIHFQDGDEGRTHHHPESHVPILQELFGEPVDTIHTLRGRVAQVSKSLDEEKAGRLRAETLIDELEGRLASERKAAELALENQKIRLESEALATRDNFLAQLTGVQSMLTEAERRARHGELMASALRFDLSEEEFQRISGECWALMKPGNIHHEEHEAHEGGEKKEGEEISTTDGTDSTDGAVATMSSGPASTACCVCERSFLDGELMYHRIVAGIGAGYLCNGCVKKVQEAGGNIIAPVEGGAV